MRKKLLVIGMVLILTIVVPLVIAQISQTTQSIHVSGTASYPRNSSPIPTQSTSPTSTQSPTPIVKTSLWFPNGTNCPTTLNNLPCNVYGPLDTVGAPLTTKLVVRNDGNVPINITVGALNFNVPSNIQFNFGTTVESNPIAVGNSANVYIAINMVTTNSNFMAQQPFAYSFDIIVTAAQA